MKTAKQHHVQVETGLEFAGEVYIWCTCNVRQSTVSLANRFDLDAGDESVFRGEGVAELQKFLRKHAAPPPVNGHKKLEPMEAF